MPQCQLHHICGLDAETDSEPGHCILHSEELAKDKKAFAAALEKHRENKGLNFTRFVFPDVVDFRYYVFDGEANFQYATFADVPVFADCRFNQRALFYGATFKKRAFFHQVQFDADSDFVETTFEDNADFRRAAFWSANFAHSTFKKEAVFSEAKFSKSGAFYRVRFEGGADFRETVFKACESSCGFRRSLFLGKTIFEPGEHEAKPIFSEVEVDFSQITLDPLDVVTFRSADLRKCLFENTDVREIEFTGVKWPKVGNRLAVYDEIALARTRDMMRDMSEDLRQGSFATSFPEYRVRSLFQIERLYRQLKHNYEERRDYERVSDFHYGEKEMRRKNPETAVVLRFFLTLYWLLSGYGERYLRPLISAGIVLIVSTFLYLKLGLRPKEEVISLVLASTSDWLRAIHYSFRVMILLKPDDLVPSQSAQWVNTVQSIAGPLLFGLFALALRQRLKR